MKFGECKFRRLQKLKFKKENVREETERYLIRDLALKNLVMVFTVHSIRGLRLKSHLFK